MEIFEVGGAVRDSLLGRAVKDRDWVVVGATAAELEAQGFRQVGADFPVFLHPETNEEYALARTERKTGQGYTGFSTDSASSVTLEQDLARRDFTVNAMARDSEGNVIDPHNGRRDLELKLLRHVGPAFIEDPLRVLRGARFAATLGFDIAPETQTLMHEIAASGELEALTPERVWQELRRALNTEHPDRFIEVLRECGALKSVLPEVDRLFGVPQPPKHHPEVDTGIHILLALKQAVSLAADEAVRFAVLVHDLGKGTTPADILPGHRGHEQRGVDLIREMCDRIRVPREHRELAELVSRLHTRVHQALDMRPLKLVSLLEDADAFRRPQRFEQFLLACKADATGRKGRSNADYSQVERLRQAHSVAAAVNAREIAAQNVAGQHIAEAIREARIAAVTRSEI